MTTRGFVRKCAMVLSTSFCVVYVASSQPSGLFHGVKGAYTMHHHSETITDMSGMSGTAESPRPLQRVVTDASIVFWCAARPDSSTEVCLDSVELSYLVNDIPQSSLAERIQSELRSVFVFVSAVDHSITRISSLNECSSEAMQFISTMLLTLQCGDLSPGRDSLFVMNDRQGRVECKVLRRSTTRQLSTVVQKLQYSNNALKNWRPGKALQQTDRITGLQQSQYARSTKQLLWRNTVDTQTVSFSGKTIVRSISACTISAMQRRRIRNADRSTSTFAQTVVIPEPDNAEETRRAAKSALWSASDTHGVLDSLDHVAVLDSNAVRVLVRKLDAGMFLIPGFTDSLVARSRQYAADDERLVILADLYSQSYLGHAQLHFVHALEQLRGGREFLSALTGFANIEQAQPATLNVLVKYAFEDSASAVRSTAVLAMSAMIHELHYTDSARADSLMTIIEAHRMAMRPSLYVAVCGNAGLTSTLAPLLSIIRLDSSVLRLESLYALRFIQHPLVDSTLGDVIRSGDSLSTTVALRALSYRQPTARTVHIICASLRTTPALRTQQLMMHVLYSWKQIDAHCLDNSKQYLRPDDYPAELRAMLEELISD